jgi:hypothetical protein
MAQNIADLVKTGASNFSYNLSHTFTDTSLKQWIRIVTIVGAYLIIRPWLVKLGARQQQKQHERDAADISAEIHPNDLRGGRKTEDKGKIALPGVDDDSSDEEGEATGAEKGANWGKKARKRQRKYLREVMEAEEKRREAEQEAESDKEIEQYLVG